MEKRLIQVEERVPVKLLVPLSVQHMFAMFGASVLVPFMFRINPAVVLLMNGVGTLLFILITKGKAPAYLGSSFAFLSPALLVIDKFGYQYALGGFVVLGVCGMIVALIIKKCGTNWIDIVLPTAAMGPVVALIGLELAGNAADTAGLLAEEVDPRNVAVFLITLGVAVFGQILFRGFLSVIPILIAIIAGYISAAVLGILDFSAVREASFFALPNFQTPRFNVEAVLTILPALLLVTSEHIEFLYCLKHKGPRVVDISDFEKREPAVQEQHPDVVKYLFTTKTCPNCRLAKEYLKDLDYIPVDAQENAELAQKFGVMQAPTLVVTDGDSFTRYANASNIRKYAQECAGLRPDVVNA